MIFTSPAAVRYGMLWIDQYWPQYPVRTIWLAVGDRTRADLLDRGLDARSPETEDSTEGLLQLSALRAPQDLPGPGRAVLGDELASLRHRLNAQAAPEERLLVEVRHQDEEGTCGS